MTEIPIKPFSVNQAYKGRKFRTKEHDKFKETMSVLLPKSIFIPEPPFEIHLEFGFSSASSDWDNCIKTTQDSIADKYGFNDKLIRKGIVEVFPVKKGSEFIRFKLEHYQKTI